MHDLAKVAVIQNITPIEGKDRIELAKVENYNSIVQKGEFKVGDKVIYIFYDAVLPEREEFEFLRKRCWNERLKGFRIKPMKMGNVISEGLVLPISVLPNGEKIPVGTVVTEQLNIRLYESPYEKEASLAPIKRPWWAKIPLISKIWEKTNVPVKRGYPVTVPKSDEENIEKKWDEVKDLNKRYYVTEKLEGQSATYIYEKGRLKVFSHNWEVGNTGNWGEYAKQTNLAKSLKLANKIVGAPIAIQGELCGPGIQKNIYGFKTLEFFMFGGYVVHSGRKLNMVELEEVSRQTGIKMVPFIKMSGILDTVEEMVGSAEGVSVLDKNIPREGTVWRTFEGDIHFKCKSRPYKVWWPNYK